MPATLRPATSTSLGHLICASRPDHLRHRHPGGQRQQRRRVAHHDRAQQRPPGRRRPRPPLAPPPGGLLGRRDHGSVGRARAGQLAGPGVGRADHAVVDTRVPERTHCRPRSAARRRPRCPGAPTALPWLTATASLPYGVLVDEQLAGRRRRRTSARRPPATTRREPRPPPEPRPDSGMSNPSPALELDVAEPVQVDRVRHQHAVLDRSAARQLEPHQPAGSHGSPASRQRRPAGQPRRHRREDVAPVKRGRHRRQARTASARCRPPRPPRRRASNSTATAARCRVPPARRPSASRHRHRPPVARPRPDRPPPGAPRPGGTGARGAGSARRRARPRAAPRGSGRSRAPPGRCTRDHAVADARRNRRSGRSRTGR